MGLSVPFNVHVTRAESLYVIDMEKAVFTHVARSVSVSTTHTHTHTYKMLSSHIDTAPNLTSTLGRLTIFGRGDAVNLQNPLTQMSGWEVGCRTSPLEKHGILHLTLHFPSSANRFKKEP